MTDARPVPGPAAKLLRLLLRFKTTSMLMAVIISAGVLTATVFREHHPWLLENVGFDLAALQHGKVWAMPAATLLQGKPGLTWHEALLVLSGLLAIEWAAGSGRALVVFFLADWITAPVATLTLWALASFGSARADTLVHMPDMGSSVAALGAASASAALATGPLRWLGLTLACGFVLTTAPFMRFDITVSHSIAIGVGIAIGGVLGRRRAKDGQPAAVGKQPGAVASS
ncbi:MAG: hypothetical protein HY874_05620 [Chloroflexi bacterium]|nr:hypothetical protein [Chloroflexota bacterium]